jgi:hypothetical protein
VVNSQAQLLEIVAALGTAGGLAHLLNGRDEQGDEDCNNGDHHQQLDQGEGGTHRLTTPMVWLHRQPSKEHDSY